MNVTILHDITVELSTQEDCALSDVGCLELQVTFAGKGLGEVKLLSRQSESCKWETDEILVLPAISLYRSR